MKTSYGNRFVGPILAVALLFSTALHAGQLDKQGPITPPSQSGAQSTQAISQTGLLPVYGVDLRLDPGWVDQKQFPSSSASFPNSGTSSTLQQVWTALQPGGYNVLRIPLDVRDAGAAANRAANLCLWAKNNNVQLILVLSDSDSGQPIGQDFPAQAATFVKTLVTLLRGNNGQYLPNYSQVMAFQLEDELNHVGKHGGMAAAVAQQLALQVAKSLRQSEKDALNGTGTAATPLMVSASFDFELIQLGAIAGGTMSDVDYNQAYQSLKQFLSGLSSSADLDLITVDWFAGSLSSGGIDKAPVLLKSLLTDISGKQIVFSAGFSTAFRSADEQKRLFATAFSNLSDLRASNGADCPFVGAIFREALNGKNASATPPRATLPAEMAKWDWKARAAELMALWTQKKKSDDMSWWLAKVENTMGIVSLQNDVSGKTAAAAASPAQQGMTQIASAVSDVNAQMAAAATPNPSAYASGFQSGATVLGTTAGQGTPATNYSAPQTSLPPQPNMAGAGAYGQPGCSNASAYLNTTPNPYGASPYGQTYNQPYSQPNNQPYGQQLNQPYGQQYGMPGTAGVNCGSSILAQSLQGEAQKGMLGLLDGVLQRLGSLTGGSSLGNGYNTYGSGYNTYGNTGSTTNPYNYNNNNGANSYNPGGQTPTNSGGQTGGYNGQQVSVPAGAVQVGQQDISLQPLKPQAGTPEIITVNLHNQSSTDVYGLVLQATGSDGSALQQQGGLHLAPNASTPVAIPWVPPNANSSYSITVNVSDGSGNQLASAQMTPVAIAAAASNEGGGNGTNGGSGSNGGSGGSGGTGTTGGGGSGGTSGGSGGGSTSCTNSGATNNPAGAVTVASIQLGTAGQPVVAGQAASVVVSLSNPNSVSLTNIAGSLCVDGNPSQNQSLSSLMPQQSRSLVFQGVILAQAGQHQVVFP